jgi:hypothetical protein
MEGGDSEDLDEIDRGAAAADDRDMVGGRRLREWLRERPGNRTWSPAGGTCEPDQQPFDNEFDMDQVLVVWLAASHSWPAGLSNSL